MSDDQDQVKSVYTNAHPECAPGEVFLKNGTNEEFDEITWQTKRQGKIPYFEDGVLIESVVGLRPIFVKASELRPCHFNCDLTQGSRVA